ncbi:MAG: hypothetical protein J3Q66DRAFT_401698 [Benniella sp.]|nr:MAG: hypothetical protein J3Q66DRAFT_401698 [Benniella sp.]
MSAGTGYIYNVKSNSWRSFSNPNLAAPTELGEQFAAVAGPETEIVFLPRGGVDFTGRQVMLSVDIRTGTVNSTGSNPYATSQPQYHPVPDGWNLLNIATPEDSWWDYGASAYGGSMMISVTYASRLLLMSNEQLGLKLHPSTSADYDYLATVTNTNNYP